MVLIPLGDIVASLCKHYGIFETVRAFGIAVIVTICITTGLWLLLEYGNKYNHPCIVSTRR